GSCSRKLGNGFGHFLAIRALDGVPYLPVAGHQRGRKGIAGRQKCRGEVTVRNARERFSALPDVSPLLRAIQLFYQERREPAVLAVEGVDGSRGGRVCHGHVAKAAAPR